MTSSVLTVRCGGPGLVIPNKRQLMKDGVAIDFISNRDNLCSPRACYNMGLKVGDEDILIYTHDDLTIHDPAWHHRVMYCFNSDPNIVAVGLGGALGLGVPDLYKKPYKLDDMARQSYWSNQTDGAIHGSVTSGLLNVAVLDAFFMAVRRDFLLSVGGWPKQLTHHCLDLWLACEIARAGKQTVMAGISCTHHGGGTSIKPVYRNAQWLQGGSLECEHTTPHEWIYDTYRDVLPIDSRKPSANF